MAKSRAKRPATDQPTDQPSAKRPAVDGETRRFPTPHIQTEIKLESASYGIPFSAPNHQANKLLRLLHNLEKVSKSVDPLQDDVILTGDTATLNAALQRPFDVPILHRPSRDGPASFKPFDLSEFQDYLHPKPDEAITAFDTTSSSTSYRLNTHRRTTIRELLTRLAAKPGIDNRPPVNFQGLRNRTNTQFYPSPVATNDLRMQLGPSVLSAWAQGHLEETFSFSSKHHVSAVHVSAPAVTWLSVLAGTTVVYFPRRATSQTIRWLAFAGPQAHEHYEGGWTKLVLNVGDTLILPPTHPHATYAPCPSLITSGLIYPAPQLSRILERLRLREDLPFVADAELGADVYVALAAIVTHGARLLNPLVRAQVLSCCGMFCCGVGWGKEDGGGGGGGGGKDGAKSGAEGNNGGGGGGGNKDSGKDGAKAGNEELVADVPADAKTSAQARRELVRVLDGVRKVWGGGGGSGESCT